jgi:hypothetical protein
VIDALAEVLRRVRFWWRWLTGQPLSFKCERTGTCKCQGDEGYEHERAHFRCRHCTNPFIECRLCHVRYFDIVAPSSVWVYDGLWKQWRHTQCTY